MIREHATVLSNEACYEGGYIIWLDSPRLAATGHQPGQFVMVRCAPEGGEPMFSRAFSVHRAKEGRIALLYAVFGRGTDWLVTRRRGDAVPLYGPLGKGFRLPDGSGNLLLVAGGVGVAPMIDLAEVAVAKGHQVTAMMGARTATQLLPAAAWPSDVEYVVVTEDGSQGLEGRVTEHLARYVDWSSKLYACGPNAMFAALADALRQNGRRQTPEILMEENMPCGWGLCYGCAIFTRHGVRLCCKDGPRFNLFDVF